MFVAFLSLKSFVIEYDFLGLKSICSRLQSCFYNMQSILAILVSFGRPMRSSTADTQITTINEQHSGLKTTKFENCGKISIYLYSIRVEQLSNHFPLFTIKLYRESTVSTNFSVQ